MRYQIEFCCDDGKLSLARLLLKALEHTLYDNDLSVQNRPCDTYDGEYGYYTCTCMDSDQEQDDTPTPPF